VLPTGTLLRAPSPDEFSKVAGPPSSKRDTPIVHAAVFGNVSQTSPLGPVRTNAVISLVDGGRVIVNVPSGSPSELKPALPFCLLTRSRNRPSNVSVRPGDGDGDGVGLPEPGAQLGNKSACAFIFEVTGVIWNVSVVIWKI
jgi:hypothetical protein